MLRTTLAAIALTLTAAPVTAGPPAAGPVGGLCHLDTTTDPLSVSAMVGVMWGGPMTTGAPGALRCKVVQGSSAHHSFGVVDFTQATDATGTATLGPVSVTYLDAPGTQFYLCTSWSTASGSLYWTAAGGGYWTTDSAKPCVALTQTTVGSASHHSA